MSSFQEVYERIRVATNTRTQVELAALLEIRQSSISDAKRRNSIPAVWYIKLFEKMNLNPDWLKKGTGPQYLYRLSQNTMPSVTKGLIMEEPVSYGSPMVKSTTLNVFGTHCLYEDGLVQPALPLQGKMAVAQAFITPGLVVVSVDSDAFSPLVHKASYVGIDTRAKHLVSGELFAFFMPNIGLTFKRLFLDSATDQIHLRTDHPDYIETIIDATTCAQRIFGRVTWVFQQL